MKSFQIIRKRLLYKFKLQQKQTSIQSRGYFVAPPEANFLSVLSSHADISSCPSMQRTPSLKLPHTANY